MTTSDEALERKVRQLDHDVQAIYEMLAGIQGTQRRHDNRFDEIGSDVGQLKVDVSGLKADVGALKADVGGLKADVGGLKADVGALKTDVGDLKQGFAELSGKVDRILAHLER